MRCAKGSASMAGRDFFGAACFSPLLQAQPDGCKEEYCEGKQKREAEQSERRKEEPEKKKSKQSDN
ncbi:MAG: hypothetical protein ACLURV_13135 [Gallintestinimicrobium sp.]